MTNSNTNTTTKLITTLTILFALTGMAAASTVTKTGNPTTDMGTGSTDVPIYQFEFSAGDDTIIQDNGVSPGDTLTDFAASDNVYIYDASNDNLWTDAEDALYIDDDNYGTYEASGRSVGGAITLDQNGFSQGSQVTSNFVIETGTNDEIVFTEDGSTTITATLTSGSYTGSGLATEINTKLEAAGSETYTVDYDTTNTNRFTISSDNSVGGSTDLLWTNAGSTASGTLGFDGGADDTGIGSTNAVSDSDVEFNIVTNNNDEIGVNVDGSGFSDYTITSGVYTSSGLATQLQTDISDAVTVDYGTSATDAFTIESDTSTLSDTPTDSSVVVQAPSSGNDLTSSIGLGTPAQEKNGYVTITDGTNDEFNVDVDGSGNELVDIVAGNTDYSDANTLVTDINNAMSSGATASWDTDHIVIKSDSTGSSSSVVVSGGNNDATGTIGFGTPTERTGDTVITGDSNLDSEQSDGTLLQSSDSFDIKYVENNQNTQFDSGEAIVEDSYGNDIYGDTLQGITVANSESYANDQVATLKVLRDTNNDGFSQNTEVVASTSSKNFGQEISGIGIDAADTAEEFQVRVDIPTDVPAAEDQNTISAEITGTSTASTTSDTSVSNSNSQTVTVPHITEVATIGDGNGDISQVDVTFSESIKFNSADLGGLDLLNSNFAIDTSTDYSTATNGNTITVDLSTTPGDTGSTTSADYTASGSLQTETNSYAVTSGDQNSPTATDGAAPVITSATTYDVDNDGDVGAATLTASEAVDGNLGATPSDFEIGGTDASTIDAVEYTDDSGTTSDNSNAKFRVDLTDVSEIEGTEAKKVNYDGSSVTDVSGNSLLELTDSDVDETDGAVPQAVEVKTFDQDSDGKTDATQIEFSEAVDDSTVSSNSAYFEIGNTDAESFSTNRIDGTSDTETDDQFVSVTIDTDSNEVSGTELKQIDYTDSALQDMNSNNFATADDIGLTKTDAATPVLKYAEIDHSSSTDSATDITLEFSENVKDNNDNSEGVKIDGDKKEFSDTTGASTHKVNYGSELQTGDSPLVVMSSEIVDTSSNNNQAVNMSGNDVEVDTFRKDLSSGWNFVSFPIADSTSPSLDSVLDMDKVDVVWEYDSDGWTSSNDDLSTVEAGQGYLVNASSDHTIAPNVNNVVSNEGAQVSSPGEFELQAGWNLVGQYQEFNQDADAESNDQAAFRTVGSSNFNTVYRQTSPGNLAGITDVGGNSGVMKTGEAFWVQTTGKIPAGSLVYSEN